jgi:hypothetical protein
LENFEVCFTQFWTAWVQCVVVAESRAIIFAMEHLTGIGGPPFIYSLANFCFIIAILPSYHF